MTNDFTAIDAVILEDQLRYLDPSLWPKSNAYKEYPGQGTSSYWKCYTRQLCRILALLNAETAQENAETYATHGMLTALQLAYPEYDFSGEYVAIRKELLHHFSGLDVLRHPDAGSICSLLLHAYDPKKDTFRGKFGSWKPQSVEKLTESLIKWMEEIREGYI